MTPYEKARQVYNLEPCVRTFEHDTFLHLMNGFVFSTPDFFVMGRGVKSKADPRMIVNPEFNFGRELQDCWHVYLMAGDMSKAWGILPYPLPMFSLERRNELRFYRFEDIARHTQPATA